MCDMDPVLINALLEVDGAGKDAAAGIDPEKARERAFFMKTTMPLLGLTVPQQRKLLRRGYSFSKDPWDRQLTIWDHIWCHAQFHETRMQAGFFIESRANDAPPPDLWVVTKAWATSINCWDQSDILSGVYAKLLEAKPDLVLPTLMDWNDSENPWLRRQSLVSLLYYARFRKRVPDRTLVFDHVRARLFDDDYYVQKGVGWTIREAYNVWPQETLAFMQHHVLDLSAAAWQAATEKLSPEQKAPLKAARKMRRRSGGRADRKA